MFEDCSNYTNPTRLMAVIEAMHVKSNNPNILEENNKCHTSSIRKIKNKPLKQLSENNKKKKNPNKTANAAMWFQALQPHFKCIERYRHVELTFYSGERQREKNVSSSSDTS